MPLLGNCCHVRGMKHFKTCCCRKIINVGVAVVMELRFITSPCRWLFHRNGTTRSILLQNCQRNESLNISVMTCSLICTKTLGYFPVHLFDGVIFILCVCFWSVGGSWKAGAGSRQSSSVVFQASGLEIIL